MMEKTIFEVVRIRQDIREIPKEYLNAVPSAIRSPQDAGKLAIHLIGDSDREHFLVICLNTKMNVTAVHIAHTGSLNASIVSIREVFKAAILNNASSIILSHNHPSYSLTPSPEDLDVTNRLVESGHLLGIDVVDHLIVNNKSSLSLKEKGYL